MEADSYRQAVLAWIQGRGMVGGGGGGGDIELSDVEADSYRQAVLAWIEGRGMVGGVGYRAE